jgi:hypothetical protein
MQSDRQLKHWVEKYDRAYWGGKLASRIIVFWEPPPQADGETCPVYEVAANQFQIKLDPAIKGNNSYWKITLLHEMIHVALWTKHPKHQHGRLFKEERRRIDELGAYDKLL